jgi:hypothetical protein
MEELMADFSMGGSLLWLECQWISFFLSFTIQQQNCYLSSLIVSWSMWMSPFPRMSWA